MRKPLPQTQEAILLGVPSSCVVSRCLQKSSMPLCCVGNAKRTGGDQPACGNDGHRTALPSARAIESGRADSSIFEKTMTPDCAFGFAVVLPLWQPPDV